MAASQEGGAAVTVSLTGVSAGRDLIITLAPTGVASKFSGHIEAFLEQYLVTETGLST